MTISDFSRDAVCRYLHSVVLIDDNLFNASKRHSRQNDLDLDGPPILILNKDEVAPDLATMTIEADEDDRRADDSQDQGGPGGGPDAGKDAVALAAGAQDPLEGEAAEIFHCRGGIQIVGLGVGDVLIGRVGNQGRDDEAAGDQKNEENDQENVDLLAEENTEDAGPVGIPGSGDLLRLDGVDINEAEGIVIH